MRLPQPEPLLLTGQPFTMATAHELGVSRGRLRSSLWRPVCRGILVAKDTPDSVELFLAAAKLVVPEGAVISGRAAAWLHGIDIRRYASEPLDITIDRHWAPSGRGLLVPHRAPLPDEDLVEIGGLLVTNPLRTAYDLVRGFDLRKGSKNYDVVEAVVAVDAFLHAGLITPDLLTEFQKDRRWPNGLRLERVLDLADAGAESPMESRLRMVLVIDAGLPRPETQYAIPYGEDGRELRVDIAYPGPHLGIEYHGAWHGEGDRPWLDQHRSNTLAGQRWHVLEYWLEDYRDRRATIVRDVTAYLRSAA
ncbi:DUF559 domain-containing protein [Acidothermaceae bacterium B102]|nr:DUF559 domain-containing protein [Acidothermaceae bacterium B102]